MSDSQNLNTRILIIDDEEAVRENFRRILGRPDENRHNNLKNAAASLFEDEPVLKNDKTENRFDFIIDEAENGKRGYERVQTAIAENKPYATIFCDMRMPVWDGVETIKHIRQIDTRAGIVVVTAYSDYDVSTIVRAAGADVGYFVKPFSNDEVLQMATRGVIEWNKAAELENLIRIVSTIHGRGDDLQVLLTHLLNQICSWLGTESAAFLTMKADGKGLEYKFGVGIFSQAEADAANEIISRLSSIPLTEDVRIDHDLVVMPLREYGCTVGILGSTILTPDRIFLLKLFAEHARSALRNSEMQSKLMEAEKMSAIGGAVSFIAHDLRNTLGTATQMIDMLKEADESIWSRDELFRIVKNCMQSSYSLADDIVGYAQRTVIIEAQDTDIRELLEDLTSIWQLHFEGNLIVELKADKNCLCHIDRNRFQRVLDNLIKNACEAVRRKKNGKVIVTAENTQSGLRIAIEDNGDGIPDELKDCLFQPFATAGKSHGTGFGLAVVKQIVDAHDASINVESSTAGTVFTIQLKK